MPAERGPHGGRHLGLVPGWQLKGSGDSAPTANVYGVLAVAGPLSLRSNTLDCEKLAVRTSVEHQSWTTAVKGGASPDQLHGSICSLCILLQECILHHYISPHATRETVSPTPRTTAMTST